MKILILGGTGAMGVHLVNLLSSNPNCRITVTSRSRREGKDNVSYVQGNGHDIAFLNTLLKDKYDVIVDFMNYHTEEFRERYRILLNACGQFVYLSSSRVYADSDSPITEESPRLLDVTTDAEYLRTDEYALAKARQENLLRESEHKNWTIIRPYITYSEIRLQLGVLEKEAWLYLTAWTWHVPWLPLSVGKKQKARPSTSPRRNPSDGRKSRRFTWTCWNGKRASVPVSC